MTKLFALELSEEFAPIPTRKTKIQHKARVKLPPSPNRGGNFKKHPFPMYIEAHSGSSVIIGGSNHTVAAGGTGPSDDMEAELLAYFRALSLRDRVEVMKALYAIREETKKASTRKGRGVKKLCCRVVTDQTAHRGAETI